jgi:NADP-dependent 3-hydroxy acid dehydrogenase YdfG
MEGSPSSPAPRPGSAPATARAVAADGYRVALLARRVDRITHPESKQGSQRLYEQLAITADDIAEIIAFAVTRPRRLTLNEILVRPTAQPG